MSSARPTFAIVMCAVLLITMTAVAGAQQAQAPTQPPASSAPATTYQPEYGQAGKDVVWVPTSAELVQKMLDLGRVTAADTVIDLGSGDGRTVIAAAKRGATAIGIEYNPEMVELSTQTAKAEGVSGKATFMKADLYETDLSKATVITMFLLTDINLKLRPTILDLKPGTRIVTNTFKMGAWEPDGESSVDGDCTSWCTAYLWIVPAKVAGTWTLGADTLTLSQDFQMVSGSLTHGGISTPLSGARLKGDEIAFTVGDAIYTGRVNGASMTGTVKRGEKTSPWSATK